MRAPCQICGAVNDIIAMLTASEYRAIAQMITELPPGVHSLSLKYLGLFRPKSGRTLSVEKSVRLLSELKDFTTAGLIKWKNDAPRKNEPAFWRKALEIILERPPKDLPLDDHNYLRRIAYGFADDSDKTEERQKIADERRRPVPTRPDDVMSFAEFKARCPEQAAKVEGFLRK